MELNRLRELAGMKPLHESQNPLLEATDAELATLMRIQLGQLTVEEAIQHGMLHEGWKDVAKKVVATGVAAAALAGGIGHHDSVEAAPQKETPAWLKLTPKEREEYANKGVQEANKMCVELVDFLNYNIPGLNTTVDVFKKLTPKQVLDVFRKAPNVYADKEKEGSANRDFGEIFFTGGRTACYYLNKRPEGGGTGDGSWAQSVRAGLVGAPDKDSFGIRNQFEKDPNKWKVNQIRADMKEFTQKHKKLSDAQADRYRVVLKKNGF